MLMLAGLASMTLAQFMEAIKPVTNTVYIGRASTGYIPNAGSAVTTVTQDGISGWSAHPIAPLVLVVLAVLFIANINFGPTWMRFRYWIANALLVVCLIPVNAQGESSNGVTFGVFALLLTIAAALFRKKEV